MESSRVSHPHGIGNCLLRRVRVQEITLEVILCEYSRHSSQREKSVARDASFVVAGFKFHLRGGAPFTFTIQSYACVVS